MRGISSFNFTLSVLFASIAMVRIVGVTYGMPFPLVSDEESIIGRALRMIELRNIISALNPEQMRIVNYPPLLPYNLIFILTYLAVVYLLHALPSSMRYYILLGVVAGVGFSTKSRFFSFERFGPTIEIYRLPG